MNFKLKVGVLLGILLLMPMSSVVRLSPEVCAADEINTEGSKKSIELVLAIRQKDIRSVRALLGTGASFNEFDRPERISILHWAVINGYVDVVQAVLGVETDIVDEVSADYGQTALHLAATGGHINVVQALLRAGACVSVTDNTSRTPLHLAAVEGHINVTKALLRAGADVNAVNDMGWTPLHFAAYCGHVSLAQVLMDEKADVNAVGLDGSTALHFAASGGKSDMVNLLVIRGVKFDAVDRVGRSARDLAQLNGHGALVRALNSLYNFPWEIRNGKIKWFIY